MPYLIDTQINPWVDEARRREILEASDATSSSAPAPTAPSSTSAFDFTADPDPYVCTLPMPDKSTNWKPTYTREALERACLDGDLKRNILKKYWEPRMKGLPKDGSTPLPDPYEEYIRQPTHTMFRTYPYKPARDSSFKPMNTLDSATAQSPRMAGKQYGKPAMGTGQTKYLALLNDESDQSPKTPDGPNLRRSCPTDEPSHSSKRARTHNTLPSSDLIEVKDNDDTIASSPPGVIGDPFAAVAHDNVVNKARTRNAVSAMSQRSQGSTTSSQRKRMSPVASAFQATDALMNSHRKKSRASNKVILWKAGDNGYECQQPPAPSLQRELVTQTGACADQAISLSDDEAPSSLKARVQNLSEHKAKGHGQVLLQDEGSEDELHIQDPATISHKIVPVKTNGSTRINHSTEPRRGEAKTTSKSDTDQNEKLSEKFQRQEDPTDPIEGDDDELASPTTTRSSRKRSLSPSKRTTQANTAVTRKSQASALRGWSLKYVKSYDIEKCGPGLSMKQILSDKAFSVDHSDGHTPPKTIAIVDLNKITKASADDASFIRIQGSKDTNGAIYWFDIEFENRQDLVDFRDYHVKPNCAGKIYLKNRAHMLTLFGKPLEHQNKTAATTTLPPVEKSLLEKRTQNGASHTDQRVRRSNLLIEKLDPKATDPIGARSDKAVQNGPHSRNSAPSAHLSRPTRATRSNRPAAGSYTETDEVKSPNEPVPYSVNPGLGNPWHKSLTFHGSGRKRALVDFEDLIRLDEGQYLNDQLIDFYMLYLFEQANIPKNKVYFFNTHFYTTLMRPVPGKKTGINYAAVSRWTAKEDIFNYDYIVVPVCEENHWYLAIICNVSNISRTPDINGLDKSSPAPEGSSEKPIVLSVEEVVDTTTTKELAKKSITQAEATIPSSEKEEEVTLFEEEQREHSDRSAEITAMFNDMNENIKTGSSSSGQSPTTAQTTRMEKLTMDESIPKGILGDAPSSPPTNRKKGKRKSTTNIKIYAPEEPIVIVLDSLGLTHSKTVRALKDYVLEEGRAKRSMDAVITQNGVYVKEAHIPQQPNYYDCGVYLLGYVQKFFEDPQTFATKILLREMDSVNDWPNMEAPKIRNSMREILQGLARQQENERKAEHKAKKAIKSTMDNAVKTQPPQKSPEPSQLRLQSPSNPAPPKSLEKISTTAEAQANSEEPLHNPPRRSSPKVVISSNPRSQQARSPKRRLEETQLHEQRHQDGVSGSHSNRSESPTKKQKIDEEAPHSLRSQRVRSPKRRLEESQLHEQQHQDGVSGGHSNGSESPTKKRKVDEEATPSTRTSPRINRSSPNARKKPADRKQRPKPKATMADSMRAMIVEGRRGSSEDPIEIDDSQDPVDDSQDTIKAASSPVTEQ